MLAKKNTLREEMVELRSDLRSHMRVEEVVQKNQELIQKNQLDLLSEIRNDVKAQQAIIQDNRMHFDSRINDCSDDLKTHMHKEFMTRHQIEVMKDESVIFHTERRRDEIKEVKSEILGLVEDKDAVILYQLGQLRKIVFSTIATVFATIVAVVLALIAYFKEG